MSDRELLEMAAKACGLKMLDTLPGMPYWADAYQGRMGPWNPLEEDGDALRLAVKLNLCPKRFGDLIEVVAPKGSSFGIICEQGVIGGDLIVSYRRAIVRAAAEIGRSLP